VFAYMIFIVLFCICMCAVVIGLLFSFVGIPIICRIKKTARDHRPSVGIKLLIAVLTGGICFIVIMVILSLYASSDEPYESDWSIVPPSAETIRVTNEARQEHGVREIKQEWSFYGRQFGEEKWKDAKGNSCKVVACDRKYHMIESEDDYYYSGVMFQYSDPDDGMTQEFLRISYYYPTKRFCIAVVTGNKEIELMVDRLPEFLGKPNIFGGYSSSGSMGNTNEETLAVAEEILRRWGLERL